MSKYLLFIVSMLITIGVIMQCEDAFAHGTHSGTGPIIDTCYGLGRTHTFLKITDGTRDEKGNLQCGEIREMLWIMNEDEEQGHPAIHLLHTYECSEWDSLCRK